MAESKNGKVIRRNKQSKNKGTMNKETGSTKGKKTWNKKRKHNKYKKKFTSASNESLQQLADHFNNNRY